MSTVIDFHAHILPGMDDGSSSVEESLAMWQRAEEQGVSRIAATPHFYAHLDSPEHFLEKRDGAYEKMCSAAAGKTDGPELVLGAEVSYFPGISQWDALGALVISGTNCILIEMPHAPWTDAMYRELGRIYDQQGITPLIAHIDRYISPFRTYGIPARLADLPVLIQANASFFLKRSTRAMAMGLLCRDQIHLLGSDCHNLTSRPPNLGQAFQVIEKCLGKEMTSRIQLCQDNVFCRK